MNDTYYHMDEPQKYYAQSGSAIFSKDQIINILGLWTIWSLWQHHSSVLVVLKQQQAIH